MMVLSGAAQAAWSLVYVAAVVGVAVVLSVSKGLATRLLTGLQSYHVASPDDGVDERAGKAAGNKGDASHQQQPKTKGDPSHKLQLVVSDITSTSVRTNRFYISYEQVMFFAACSIIHFVASEVLRRAGLPHVTDHGSYLVLCAVSSVFNAVLQTQRDKTTCPPLEKTVAVIAGVASAAIAAVTLWLLPARFIHFDINKGAAELFPAMQAYLKANRDLDLTLPSVPPSAIKLLLTAAAAAIGGLLAAPALRSMRCYHLATEPPAIFDSTAAVSVAGPFTRLALHVAVATPMLCSTLWFKPLWSPLIQSSGTATGELPWRLSSLQFDEFRMWALLACGMFGLLVLRLLLQAYLQSAIVQWFELRHQDAQAVSHNQLYAKVELTNLLFCKAAVQLLSGPLLVLLFAGLLRGKLISNVEELPGWYIIPPSLWRATLSFLAWWTCAVWTVMTATVLALFRFGFLH